MSLAVLADHLASKGRNGDTMLVHMTPGEVQGLHALALAHGGKLTINPETGLPEANFLKRLLPMIAGMALNAFLPGVGTAIGAALGGLSGAVGTGILVGGVTGLATGSLRQGIMAGLGAYGGASLAGGLQAAGSATAGAPGVEAIVGDAAAQQQLAAANELSMATAGQPLSAAESQRLLYSTLSPTDKLTSGISALGSEQGRAGFMEGIGGKTGLYKAGAAALAPGMMPEPVATTTPRLPFGYTPRKRPMAFNQETQTFEPLEITPAIEEPKTAKSGGIVALANGGNTDPTQRATPTAAQFAAQQSIVADPVAAARQAAISGINAGMTDQQIADMVNMQYGKTFNAQNVADFMKTQGITRPAPVVKPPVIESTPAPTLFPGTTPGVISTGEPFTPTTSTMEQVRSAYVQGGGRTDMPTITNIQPTDRTYTQNEAFSLLQGYLKANPNAQYKDVVSFARSRGIPEMQAKAAYNEFRFSGMTGGSSQAYDYLMGRGAYPIKPFLPSGTPVMRPYAESVGLAPQGFYSGRKLNFDQTGNPTGTAGSSTSGSSTSGSSSTSSSGAKVQWRNESTGELVDSTENDPKYKDNPEWRVVKRNAHGGLMDVAAAAAAHGGQIDRYNLGGYSDGGRLLRGPGDGVSDSIPATIGNRQPARLADGEFVIPARIVSEIGNGSTEAGARKLYAMMDRVQRARAKTTGKGRVAKDTKADKYLPA